MRPGRRALRGAPRGGGAGRDRSPGSAPPVHGRPASLHTARGRPQGPRPAGHDPGLPAAARHRAPGLRLRRSLRARRRALPRGGASVLRRLLGAPEQVLVPRTGARPSRARWQPTSSCRGRPLAAAARGARRADEGVQATRSRRPCAHRRQRRDLAGRDARPRRRVGQREDDPRADAAGHRPIDVGKRDARGNAATRALPEALAEGTARPSDRVPEPGLGPQPPPLRPSDPAPLAAKTRGCDGTCGRGAHERPRGARPPDGAHAHAEARSALRRPQAACGHRAGVRRRPQARRVRRADVGARRVRPGRDPQSARGATSREASCVRVHLSRPRRRPLHLGPHRRPLPRPSPGARAGRRRLRGATPSRTPKRSSPRYRRSTAAVATGSGSRATSRVRPPHLRAVSSTHAAPAFSVRSVSNRSRRSSRPKMDI